MNYETYGIVTTIQKIENGYLACVVNKDSQYKAGVDEKWTYFMYRGDAIMHLKQKTEELISKLYIKSEPNENV